MMTGIVLAVAGCKGGVGKTTTSINIGAVVEAAGGDVLVIETDIATANVCDFLDLDCDPERDITLHDVLSDEATIEDAIYSAPDGLEVLPSGSTLDGFAKTNLEQLATTVGAASERFDLVVLDTPAGISRETLLPMAIADGVIIVSTPRLSSVRDAKKTADLVERVGGTNVGLVLTHTGSGNAPPGERIAEFLDIDLIGEIPEDPAIPRSQDAGRTVVDHAPNSVAAKAYRAVGDKLSAINRPKTRKVTGLDT